MKELLVLILLLALPWVGRAISKSPWKITAVVFLIGFLNLSGEISFTAYFQDDYHGTDYGYCVTLVDVLIYVLYFATWKRRAPPAPFRFVRYTYFVICLLSLWGSPLPLFGAFAVWTLLKCYVLLSALSRALVDRKLLQVLLDGLAFGMVYNLLLCLWQRYGQGLYQVYGAFNHQNTLGSAAYLVAALMLPGALNNDERRVPVPAIGLVSSCLTVVLSLSRGCLAMLPFALSIIYIGTTLVRPTKKKYVVGLVACLAATAIVIRASATIIGRFESAPKESAETRVGAEAMAYAIADDHPLGVGLNQFAHYTEEQVHDNYLRVAEKAIGYKMDGGFLVHNIYLLTLAEIGYLGMFAYIGILLQPMKMALFGAWRFRRDKRSDLLLGCFGGLLAYSIHAKLEWIMRQYRLMVLFWIICAIIDVVRRELKEDRRQGRIGRLGRVIRRLPQADTRAA